MPRLASLTSSQLTGVNITYSVAPAPAQYLGFELNASSYNEGATITATVSTANVTNGTTVGYTVTGVSTNDLSSGSLSGNITISSDTGSVQFTLNNDGLTEGTDTFVITLASTDSAGTSTGSLFDNAAINDTSNDPTTTLWLGTNDQATTVRSIIGGFSMQINGVFSPSPTVPVTIEGRNSGARTTITAVTANTGTFIEVDDTGNSTNFTVGEQLNRVIGTAVVNGTFTTSLTGWTATGSASSVSGRAVLNANSGNSQIQQLVAPITNGTSYRVNYDIVSWTGPSTLSVQVGDPNSPNTNNITDFRTGTQQETGTSSSNQFLIRFTASGGTVTIDNVTITAVPGGGI